LAAAEMLYAETVSPVNETTTTFEDCAEIAAGSFTAGDTYLILGNAYVRCSSASNNLHARLVNGPDGSESAFTDGSWTIDIAGGGGDAFYNCQWAYVYDQPGGGARQVKIQIARSADGANSVNCDMSQIVAINLSDLVENTDWWDNEVTADYTNTTSFVDQANVTFTANGTDTYLAIGAFVADINNNTGQLEARLEDSVAGALEPLYSVEGSDTAETKGGLVIRAYVPSAASHNIAIQTRDETGTANSIVSTRLILIRLNAFDQFQVAYTEAEDAGSWPTFETVQTISFNPDVTGNWCIIGSQTSDIGGTGNYIDPRLSDDNDGSMGPDPDWNPSGRPNSDWAKDATDEMPMLMMKVKSFTTGGTRTVNLESAAEGAVEDRLLVGFSAELASAVAATSLIAAPFRQTSTLYRL
jgi:hypothetical protein